MKRRGSSTQTRSADREVAQFRYFSVAAMVAISAMASVLLAEFYLPDSLQREIIVASTLIIAAISGIVAGFFYLALLIGRIRRFLKH